MSNGYRLSDAEKREELERFTAAADRMVARARADKAYAEKLLRKIGHYEMMEHQRAEEAEQARQAERDAAESAATATAPKASRRKAAPEKRKATKAAAPRTAKTPR